MDTFTFGPADSPADLLYCILPFPSNHHSGRGASERLIRWLLTELRFLRADFQLHLPRKFAEHSRRL